MAEQSDVLTAQAEIDSHKLDDLMTLSGELVIIRSQYARTERLLQQDILRQKDLVQGIESAKALLDAAVKEPARFQKSMADLAVVLGRLCDLGKYDAVTTLLQGMGHTTSALEKASSELQSGIVKLRIEALGGRADTSTAMAIVPALLVVVGEEICAFPLSAVTEIINVPKKDIYTVDGNATMKLRDHALSLTELSKIIQFEANSQKNENHIQRVVVITDGQDKLGVIVDSLLGKDEIVLKSLTKHFADVKGVVGASILADGNVALILDPPAIIKQSK